MIRNICVYAASSDAVAPVYVEAAHRLGALMAERGYTLVYGAGKVGLMGVLARAVHQGGGRVLGVIPDRLRGLELAYEDADELIVTHDLRARKAAMEERADAFIALPGGFGTLEEILEVLTLKQLWYHQKPLVFLNVNGIYNGLLAFFEDLIAQNFIKDTHRMLYHVSPTPEDTLDFLKNYIPSLPGAKWF